ncbi:LysR substrate-binding domain-containing protein [Pararhodobacter sp.]|uniref:LysR substrate-binding domain-containing protein n=1 Tax=Pararhodobacter sp. TaxID=2127056 RepID=UPI002FDED640
MQPFNRISLNALRVFTTAAECGSLSKAALRLGVTAGAVSHQIRALEGAMGVTLFHRANNAIRLTETGETLFRQSLPGILGLERAVEAAISGAVEVSVQVPVTLATRWLIPRLEQFRAPHPDLRIRIETTGGTGFPTSTGADFALAYFPLATAPADAEVFLEDRCRPYLSPALLARITDPRDLACIPALQSASENWDWACWLHESGHSTTRLSYSGRFDMDDAALRAAIAGLGMVLAPEFIIRDDLADNRLCPLPDCPEVRLGAYVLRQNGPGTRQTEIFLSWLRECRA